MTTEISDLGAAEVSQMYEKGTLSPVEVAQASLNCAERCTNLNVFVRPPDREQVFAQARQSEARWRSKSSLGKLDGVPITVIVGNAFADRLVLAAARAYEEARSASPFSLMKPQS